MPNEANTAADNSENRNEIVDRLEHIEERIEDLQRLVDLQLESTADIKTHLRERSEEDGAS